MNQTPTPYEFLCPITNAILQDPVLTEDGQTYQRTAIIQWFQVKKTSPLTGKRLDSTKLIPNIAIKNAIKSFADNQQKTNKQKQFQQLYRIEIQKCQNLQFECQCYIAKYNQTKQDMDETKSYYNEKIKIIQQKYQKIKKELNQSSKTSQKQLEKNFVEQLKAKLFQKDKQNKKLEQKVDQLTLKIKKIQQENSKLRFQMQKAKAQKEISIESSIESRTSIDIKKSQSQYFPYLSLKLRKTQSTTAHSQIQKGFKRSLSLRRLIKHNSQSEKHSKFKFRDQLILRNKNKIFPQKLYQDQTKFLQQHRIHTKQKQQQEIFFKSITNNRRYHKITKKNQYAGTGKGVIQYLGNQFPKYVYQGQYVNGLFHGFGKLEDQTGNIYVGKFQKNKKKGFGVIIFNEENREGDRYEGNWSDDTFNGYGKYIFQDGHTHEGYYFDGVQQDYGKLQKQNEAFQGFFRHGVKDGTGILQTRCGRIFLQVWSQGKLKQQQQEK